MSDLHFDCFSGLAGDMFLGACLDLGMPLGVLEEVAERLDLDGIGVEARPALRGGFAGTRFRVLQDGRPLEGPDPDELGEGESAPGTAEVVPQPELVGAHADHDHGEHRNLGSIRSLINASGLAPEVRERAVLFFARLAEAEGKAHGMPPGEVHFHEVGAVDSIVDLVGAAAAIEHLAPERITCGRINVGGGTANTAHGRIPVPGPATAHLLAGMPVYGGSGGELLTPTGAVLLAELVDSFGEMPLTVIEGHGYGLGRAELPGTANAFRLWRGRAPDATAEVLVVEAELDDLSGEGFGYLMERLLEAGALDVYYTPVQMKKSRPGVLVTLLCRRAQLERLAGALLAESGSLGCRYHPATRFEAVRETLQVDTEFGAVAVKRASFQGREVALAPSFDDCSRLARAAGVPWREVHRAALAAAGGTASERGS